MPDLFDNIGYTFAFICGLLAVHLLMSRASNRVPAWILGSTFALLAVHAIFITIVITQGRSNAPTLIVMLVPVLALCIGPLFYSYFRLIAEPTPRFSVTQLIHCLPALLVSIELGIQKFWIDIDLVIVMSLLTYATLLSVRTRLGRRQFEHLDAHANIAFQWLKAATGILWVSLISEVLINVNLAQGGALKQSPILIFDWIGKLMLIALAILQLLRQPTQFSWLLGPNKSFRQTAINDQQSQQFKHTVAQFEDFVTNQQAYTDASTSLKSIAKQLNIPIRQLSSAINHVYQESFSKRMNRFRVAHAKQLLAEPSPAKLIAVMYDSGFRTKSSFNKEFQAIEGISPSEYRRQVMSNKQV
ncbi:AraC family transcriptional regulator [Arenicella xantha]|nr:helix-turn-helix domain-containing protein [Arenicella xantha]